MICWTVPNFNELNMRSYHIMKTRVIIRLANLLSILFLCIIFSLSVEAELIQISSTGIYPQNGDSFLFLVDGGYATLEGNEVNDIDTYSNKGFSIESIVDIKENQKGGKWPCIFGKTHYMGIYNKSYPGWCLGFTNENDQYLNSYPIYGEVSDGVNRVTVTNYAKGIVHIVMTWDCLTKTLSLYIDGQLVNSGKNTSIDAANIKTNYDLMLGRQFDDLNRNIFMVRWWKENLTESSIRKLADNWLKNRDEHVPADVNTEYLHSEWLMDEECSFDGLVGTGFIKDSRGRNHLKLTGNASLKISKGLPLKLLSPANGQNNINKYINLKVNGGDATLGEDVKHPLSYYFQIDTSDTFNSTNLQESGWISHYSEFMPSLTPNTKYFWRVRVGDNSGKNSEYSVIYSFITEPPSSWFVRPAGGNYGNENGTSYENAWSGLHNVVWGESGVEPGDTLYICGLHVLDVTYPAGIQRQGILTISSGLGDEESSRITIRGDYQDNINNINDPGIVWGAYKMNYSSWQDEGGGIWSINLPGGSYIDWFFQDIGSPSNASFIVLNKASSIDDLRSHPGSHYSENYSNKLYVKCTDGENPTGRIYGNRYGYSYDLSGQRYITFANLKFYCFEWKYDAASHIRWEGCTMAYGESTFLRFWDGSDYMEIIGCDLSWAINGIGVTAMFNETAPSHFLFKRNKIHDIAMRESQKNGDGHAIYFQGGHDGIIEENIMWNCHTGPLLYSFYQEIKNIEIRRNYIKDMISEPKNTGWGIATGCSNNSLSDKTGIKIYYNIIRNCDVGIRLHFEDIQEIYNNTVYNCRIGLEAARSFIDPISGINYGPKVKARNNIFYNDAPDSIFIKFGSGGNEYLGNFDNNLFYPDGPEKFFYNNRYTNFKGWQSHAATGYAPSNFRFDPNGLISDPFFINSSKKYLDVSDFELLYISPAIDSGENLDKIELKDFSENSIFNRADIGAYEFQNDSLVPPGNLKILLK